MKYNMKLKKKFIQILLDLFKIKILYYILLENQKI